MPDRNPADSTAAIHRKYLGFFIVITRFQYMQPAQKNPWDAGKILIPGIEKITGIFLKNLLTIDTPCAMMILPVKKGYFFAAIFQLRAVICSLPLLNSFLAGVIQGGNFLRRCR